MESIVKRLRNREKLNIYDRKNKWQVRFQLNTEAKGVCWERWVKCIGATDKNRWVNHNKYLSLKDVVSIVQSYKK